MSHENFKLLIPPTFVTKNSNKHTHTGAAVESVTLRFLTSPSAVTSLPLNYRDTFPRPPSTVLTREVFLRKRKEKVSPVYHGPGNGVGFAPEKVP